MSGIWYKERYMMKILLSNVKSLVVIIYNATHPSGGRQQWPPAIVGTNGREAPVGGAEGATW